MTTRRLPTIAMATFLAYTSALARPAVLGVVVEAHRVHLNTGEVSVGATVYDGDRFSTETEGTLLLQDNGATLQLAGESEVIVRSSPNGAHGTEAELTKGTLAFSSSHPGVLEVVADQARICPAREEQTTGQVTVLGPRELQVYARRGALQFSYQGETKTIPQGTTYRVLLDPSGDTPGEKGKGPVNPRKARAIFLLTLSGGLPPLIFGLHEAFESPERP